ncbi:MAG: HDIG domain-containing protein [Acidimicrobiales bacterium]
MALRREPPNPHDEAWAATVLSAAELALFRRHRPDDRRHALAVARTVQSACSAARTAPPTWVLPAALLHDIGKVDADLGTAGRVVASLCKLVRVRTAPGTLGRYLRYERRGAELLTEAGAHPCTAAWAAEHHAPAERWTVPLRWGRLLSDADHHAV